MKDQDTQLLTKERISETVENSGRSRRTLLLALLLVGAAVSFGIYWRYNVPANSMAEMIKADSVNIPQDSRQPPAKSNDASHMSMSAADSKVQSVTPATSAKQMGFKVTRLTTIADGGFVDLRFEITDAKKTSKTLDPKTAIYLLDEKTNKSVSTAQLPKLGNLRPQHKTLEAGTTYYMEFENANRMFQAGDNVTLATGPYRLRHLKVQ